MKQELDGKVIAVTGGFGTLGIAVAQAAIARGARVALLDRAATPASALPENLREAALFGDVDLGMADAAHKAMAAITARYGRLDGLVNAAGAFRWEMLERGDLHSWDMLYAANLRTAVNATQAALPFLSMQAGASIVNVGAAAALKAGVGMGAYAASKAGVARLTEALAEELKERGITVNAVLPSIIDTPPNRADMPDADFSRWVTPAQLSEVILFLLSPRAAAVTGALIPVTGRV